MARGVSAPFLTLLDDDAKTAGRRALVVIAAALVVIGLSALAHWAAPVWAVPGAVLGVLLGRRLQARRQARWEATLQDDWNGWMEGAFASQGVHALDAAAHETVARPTRFDWALGVLVVWIVEVAVWIVAEPDTADFVDVLPLGLWHGLVAGVLAGAYLRRRHWSRRLRDELDEMVSDGELGVWGSQ